MKRELVQFQPSQAIGRGSHGWGSRAYRTSNNPEPTSLYSVRSLVIVDIPSVTGVSPVPSPFMDSDLFPSSLIN